MQTIEAQTTIRDLLTTYIASVPYELLMPLHQD